MMLRLLPQLRSIVSVATTAFAYICLVSPPTLMDAALLLVGVGICGFLHSVERLLA